MAARAVDNPGCCPIYSPKTQNVGIGAAVVMALVASVFIVLGALGMVYNHVGNVTAVTAGGAVLFLSLDVVVALLCLKKRVETPAAPATPDSFSQEQLFKSVSSKKVKVFKAAIDAYLAHHKPDEIYNLKDSVGRQLTHCIACYGTPEMVSYLKSKGFQFRDMVTPSDNYGVLHWAVDQNNAGIIASFVAWKADVNKQEANNRYTPLHLAVWRGKVGCFKALIEAGALLDAENADGETPLDLLKVSAFPLASQEIQQYVKQKFPGVRQ